MYFNCNICACSGDAGKVSLLSTRYRLQEIKLNVTKEWRAWFEGRQVGGWVEEYEGGLTFARLPSSYFCTTTSSFYLFPFPLF